MLKRHCIACYYVMHLWCVSEKMNIRTIHPLGLIYVPIKNWHKYDNQTSFKLKTQKIEIFIRNRVVEFPFQNGFTALNSFEILELSIGQDYLVDQFCNYQKFQADFNMIFLNFNRTSV